MNESDSDLRFDKATYAQGAGVGGGAAVCAQCRGPLGDSYWKWQQHIVCTRCRDGLARGLRAVHSPVRFAKAVLFGGGIALACGAAYAVLVVAFKGTQFALVTIGIGFVVARVVRKASGGIGGTRFQVLAVALTYVASTMGYLPNIWNGLNGSSPVWAIGVMLAAPFLTVRESPIGLLIVGFGLWEAWKLTRGVPLQIEGPFRAGAGSTEPLAP